MISGNLRTFDFRFGDEFVSFLEAAGKASVTIKTELSTINEQEVSVEEVRFNYQDSLTRYKQRLDSSMHKAIESLKEMLEEIYPKLDKLSFLAHFIVEIASCKKYLSRTSEGWYRHKQFTISNISKEGTTSHSSKTEDDFSEHYYWMEHYLEKMSAYLQILKTSIEVTTQSEIKPAAHMLPDPKTSTEDKPFEFFDFLFYRNGFFHLRMDFLPTPDSYAYDNFKWDKEAEVVTYYEQDPETGEWEETKAMFIEHLKNRIYSEFQISKSLIDGRVSRCATKSEAEFYVERCIVHLKYFLIKIPRHKERKKYDFLEGFARALIIYLFERYATFCGTPDELVTAIMKATQTAQQQLPGGNTVKQLTAPGVTVFTPKGISSEALASILQLYLKQICFADDLDIEQLGKAFSGQAFEQPLGIRWTCRSRNGQVNKKALIYLFSQLEDAGLILDEGENREFIKRVNFVFVDGDGNRLQNLNVSNAMSGKKTKTTEPYKLAIDTAIAALISVKK